MFDVHVAESVCDQDRDSDTMSINVKRRRTFQRQACILSVMAAFTFGLALGIFVPLIGLSQTVEVLKNNTNDHHLPQFLPSIDDTIRHKDTSYSSVSFIAEEKFENTFEIDQKDDKDTMIIRKFDPDDRSIKEYTIKRTPDGFFHREEIEKKLSQPSIMEQILASSSNDHQILKDPVGKNNNEDEYGIVKNDVFWGSTVEKVTPNGFNLQQNDAWSKYLENAEVDRLEIGCGRMQNRLIVFKDGTRACVRYRQNTDQIQGELFSFYLGQLLNLANLAPSAASTIDVETKLWSSVTDDISNAQWKSTKPVVITKWISNLEPAGIPKQFQPIERHLNKYDVRNISLGLDLPPQPKGLLDTISPRHFKPSIITPPSGQIDQKTLERLVELAQWSDLIIFDYLIANLDRVVNNLYNFQWNADIMAAPAHNLAKQSESNLLVFLDNESGLLHGYRLLKKYEAYHGLLLDNLCVFRKSTIESLKHLRDNNVGRRLSDLFEQTASHKVRDVLPPLPDKSVKILVDRIDRVLGQVQKCREMFANR